MRQMVSVQVKKIHPAAVIPSYSHLDDSGFDLTCCEGIEIPAGEVGMVRTGLCFEIPNGYEIQIRMRSGAASKTPMILANAPGTIDAGYRGEVKLLIRNVSSTKDLIITAGTAIAQGVLCEVPLAVIREVRELSSTARGDGGFGSTGDRR